MYIKLIIVKATWIFIVWGNPKRKKFFHWDKYINIFIYINFIILIISKCTILYSMVPVHFPRPQWNPCTYKHPLFMFTSPAPATTDLSSWIGLFWTFPIESQYVAFCICLLSLSILLSGLVCVVGCISSSFLFMNNIPYMTIAYIFIHCAVDSIQQMMVVISRVVSAFCLFWMVLL